MSPRIRDLADVIEQLIDREPADEQIEIALVQADWAEILQALRLSSAHEEPV